MRFIVSRRNGTYGLSYWSESADFPRATKWALASWVTAKVPDDTNGVAFGLSLIQNGKLPVDDVGFVDVGISDAGTTR